MIDTRRRQLLGGLLKEVRESGGITIGTVAERLGVSTVQVYRIEHGQRSFDLADLPAVAKAYEIAAEDLAERLDVATTAARKSRR
jgi:transcriptional regulator with XRE-family HTH domain